MAGDRAVALAQSQIGTAEDPPGSNCQPFSHALGRPCEQWCQDFAEWVVAQAGGRLFTSSALTNDHVAAFKGARQFDQAPELGALAYFTVGATFHVGIVESWTAADITTIDGNTSVDGQGPDEFVARRTRPRAWLAGIGHPEYQMTRTMADSTAAADLPVGRDLYAAYVDGSTRNVDAVRARFPGKTVVTITVLGGDADVADVETGDLTPTSVVAWVKRQRAAGKDPTVYTLEGWWSTVRAAFHAAGVTEPHWWLANYDNNPTLPAGAVAKQYANPPLTGGHFDASVVADYWPGVDPAPVTKASQEEHVNKTFVNATPQGVVATFKALDGVTDVNVPPNKFQGVISKTPASSTPGIDGKSIVIYANPAATVEVRFT
jgi:hypothetical protein